MGSSGPRSHQQQDKNLWVHLVGHLKKKSLLPVVVFTLSKRRCEENAATLGSTDLCDAKERSEVHLVWEKALGRLKGVCVWGGELERIMVNCGCRDGQEASANRTNARFLE